MFWDTLANFMNVASTAVGVISNLQEGNAAAKAAKFNQNISNYNAMKTRQAGALEEDRVRREARKRIGLIRANVGASGLDGGSADDLLSESMFNAEMDALTVRYNHDAQATSYSMQAGMYGDQAKDARTASYLAAGQTLLRGATNLYKNNTDYGAGDTPFELGGGSGDYSMYNDGTVIRWNK